MRIRLPFAGAFFFLCLAAGYAGLSTLHLDGAINDKVLHLLTFFALTTVFYWIVDTNRRRTLNLTLAVCTGLLGVGSEFVQAILPNGREFDLYDIVANVVGSLFAVGLCSWYHLRMLERKRLRRTYTAVPGDDDGGNDDDGDDDGAGRHEDVELGEGIGAQESGIADVGLPDTGAGAAGGARRTTLEDEVDNWDENASDAWDDAEGDLAEAGKGGPNGVTGDHGEAKKRSD